VDWLKAQGAEIIDVSLPHTKYALPAYYIVAPPKPHPISRAYDGVATAIARSASTTSSASMNAPGRRVRPRSRRRIMIGTYVLSAAITMPITCGRRKCAR
jgi:aspartyl-tRNA(Asn)/glutamyl-tRNA(Gln) amidotransferase subunit A